MTAPASAATKLEAATLYAIAGDTAMVAEEYGVTTVTVLAWARAHGVKPHRGRRPADYCQRGHDMAEWRSVNSAGQTFCLLCARATKARWAKKNYYGGSK